jgi:hypothetical protein
MPYITEWVEPAVFLEHLDVTVWYTYKNDDIDNPRVYCFTTDPDWSDGMGIDFDVRELPGYDFVAKNVRETIINAIESGFIGKHEIP